MPALPLPPVLDTAAAAIVADQFGAAMLDGDELLIDGSAVERIGLAGLQLLASARRTTGLTVKLVGASEPLRAAARTAGLAPILLPTDAAE